MAEQVAVFIRHLLVSLIREIENCNGRRDNLDSVVYRTDWLYNSLVRYLGVNNSVTDQLVSLVRDAKDQLEVLVHVYAALVCTKLKPKIKGAAYPGYICVWSSQKPN